jgi:RNA polymerase sigma-70 factor (ECF subfamily)
MDARPGSADATPRTDLEALLAARAGDEQAGRYLMSEFGPSMARTAWRVLGRYGGNEADDVVQEGFIAALTTNALPVGDVGGWLRAIAARKALDWLRRSRRRQEHPLEDEVAEEPAAGDGETAPADVLTARQLLARLSPIDRAVLTLVDLEGRSMAETAEMLGSTRVAVKLRASRARRKLARMVDRPGESQRRGRR